MCFMLYLPLRRVYSLMANIHVVYGLAVKHVTLTINHDVTSIAVTLLTTISCTAMITGDN